MTMKTLRKYIKPLATFLSILLSLQSCVIYERMPSSLREAGSLENRRMQVCTLDGSRYHLQWIEMYSDSVRSIVNTTRAYVDPEKIIRISVDDPSPRIISIPEALEYNGIVHVNDLGSQYDKFNHHFFRLVRYEDQLIGYEMIKKDTMTVYFPANQIDQIILQDKIGSTAGNVAIILGSATITTIFALFCTALSEMDLTGSR